MTIEDHRTPTEHDCDRITYSDAFRRLGGVTQVVAVGEMPLFHTRLTHTLKVAQLSRRIAEHVHREEGNAEILASLGGIDPSAAEAAGLAHDLGHPPFGHVGEDALNKKCESHRLDGYEGNAQTFRILAKLARRRDADSYGLDLSSRTLRAVLKYPWLREGAHAEDKKWNAYPTEEDEFTTAREGFPHEGQSIEAAIMDWADDITYAVHDLEDFLRAGLIPLARLREDPVEMAEFTTAAAARLAGKSGSFDRELAIDGFKDTFKMFFPSLGHHSGTAQDLIKLQRNSGLLINRYVSAVSVRAAEVPLEVSEDIQYEVGMLKQLTWHYVIDKPALASLQQGQQRLVIDVFERLMDWLEEAERKSQTYRRLPTRLRDLYSLTVDGPREHYANDEARCARAAADYISSLTENQATDLFERLTGVARHSVLDPWLAY